MMNPNKFLQFKTLQQIFKNGQTKHKGWNGNKLKLREGGVII